jgi:Protein of unknown function (DUF4232)
MKTRHKLAAPLALAAAAATLIAMTMGAGSALAKPSAGSPHHYSACAARQLSMTVPKAIAGDPTEGMGWLAWNVLLRNTGKAGCSLNGWPDLSVTTGANSVAITSQHVSFNNLGPVKRQIVALAAGQQAVVTAEASDNSPGCQARWDLTLKLPGSAGSLTGAEPAEFFGPCGGGALRLSPYYPRSTLTKAINELQGAHSPSPYRTTKARVPAPCTAPRMRMATSYGSADRGGSVEVLRLVGRDASACVLAGGWPTVTLHSPDGTTQIAKALPGLPKGDTRSSLVDYQRPNSVRTELPLSRAGSASIALVTQTSGSACHVATTATIYPGPTDTGAGLTVRLARPVTFCGLPRVLSFLAGRPSANSLMPATQALSSGGMIPDGDKPAGFWYGSDSNAPVPTSSSGGSYLMPHSPTGGDYGGYIGELGAWNVWQGCTSGVNWNQTGYLDAQSNYTKYSEGVGAGVYWQMGGPGREPGGYSSSTTTATNWGTSQAERAVSDFQQAVSFPYIFMDIEAADAWGWNEGFSGPCSGTETAGSIPAATDRDTFNGFWDYIEEHSAYLPAVYEAGGGGGNSWNAIFTSSETLSDTMEWTYVNETSSISTFPTSWSVDGVGPVWYASAPTKCEALWQWSGGNGQTNGVGDFDQIDGNLDFNCV